jgi:hypothetical protein
MSASSPPIAAPLKPLLAAYGREHGGCFILFGSAARGTSHDQSDVAIHTYDRFSERKAEIAVEAAETLLALVEAEFASFRATIDPD